MGGELDYLDEGTLAAAIKSRRTLWSCWHLLRRSTWGTGQGLVDGRLQLQPGACVLETCLRHDRAPNSLCSIPGWQPSRPLRCCLTQRVQTPWRSRSPCVRNQRRDLIPAFPRS